MEDIVRMLQKNQCVDYFRDINKNDDEFEIKKDSIEFMRYKFEAKRHYITLNKIKLILSLGIAYKSLYLKLVLKRIQVAKLILMNDIEYGDEGLLTNDISQDRWPYSFRFYDFVLLYVE